MPCTDTRVLRVRELDGQTTTRREPRRQDLRGCAKFSVSPFVPAAFVRVREDRCPIPEYPDAVDPDDPEARNAKVRYDDDPSTTTSPTSTTLTTPTPDERLPRLPRLRMNDYFDYFDYDDYFDCFLSEPEVPRTRCVTPTLNPYTIYISVLYKSCIIK